MIRNTKQGILDLLIELVKIPSVSRSNGEVEICNFMNEKLLAHPYFQKNCDNIGQFPVPDDGFERKVLFALFKAKPSTSDTVILTGHYDVVDTNDCGDLRDLAFSPVEYTQKLKESELKDSAKIDLDSGDYLFGRGVMDMKCGLASEIALLSEVASSQEDLGVNLLFLAVPDEEVDASGMRAATSLLAKLEKEKNLNFIGAIMTEPSGIGSTSGQEDEEEIFLGTVGKMLPFFYCSGIGSHVGQYFSGFSASLLAAHCTLLMEANPKFSDKVGTEILSPPASLYLRDLRDGYFVTLPERAAVMFNLLTLKKMPPDVINEMGDIAKQAAINATGQIQSSALQLGIDLPELQVKTMTFEEFTLEVNKKKGIDVEQEILKSENFHNECLDVRQRSLSVISEMLSWIHPDTPMIITGFLPPYCPHRINNGHSLVDRNARTVAENLCSLAKKNYGISLRIREFYQGISDLSYLGFQGNSDDADCMAKNMPGWGNLYRIKFEDLMRLKIPVINLGPSGKDAHKPTERLKLSYSLEIFPKLLKEAVKAFKTVS